MITGGTTFGFVRKRMAELLLDFAARLKADGAFGALTTVDNPDLYKSDPLVQLAVASAASDAELHEVVEFYFKQFDPYSSQGRYLESYWGIPRFGIPKQASETWAEYEAKIQDLIRNGAARSDIAVAAMQFPGVQCAAQIISTEAMPVSGMPIDSSMIVIKACDPIDYDALAQHIFENTEFGIYAFTGDQGAVANTGTSGCYAYQIQPACRIFVGLEVDGYYVKQDCLDPAAVDLSLTISDQLKAAFAGCNFGTVFRSDEIKKLIQIDNFVVTDIRFTRRAPQLVGEGCPDGVGKILEVCGAAVEWISSAVCKYCSGEVWCDDSVECLSLQPWEFPDFDLCFTSVNMVAQVQC